MVRATRRLRSGDTPTDPVRPARSLPVRLLPRSRPAARRSWSRRDLAALAAWAALVAVAAAWGAWLLAHGARMRMWALPLAGNFRPRLGPRALPALAFAALTVVWATEVARRIRWRSLLVASFGAAAAWAVLLAVADGPHGLIRSVLAPADVSNDLASVHSATGFLSTFVGRIGDFAVHTRAHPPGLLLVLWWLSRHGIRGPGWQASLEIAGGAAAVPAVLVAVANVAGREAARAAAPFVALAPAAVFVATSADALFAGVAAWSVALLVCATGRGLGGAAPALAGGVLLAAGLFLSYGVVLVLAIPVAIGMARRDPIPLALAALPVLGMALAFGAAGFWWWSGLEATRHQYMLSVAARRPGSYFLLANLAAFAIALGPAVAVGLARLRDRGVWLLVAGALVAVAVADLSGLSKGEVERIWLPFAPWVLAACCSLGAVERDGRRWIALQVASAIALQVAVRSPW